MNCEQCLHFYITDVGTCDLCQTVNDDKVLFKQADVTFYQELDPGEAAMLDYNVDVPEWLT